MRIDPRSHGVVARLSVPSPLADVAIATGPDAVWAVPIEPIRHNGGAAPLARPVTAVRIDPRTNRVVARVTLRAPAAGGATARANLRPAGIVSRPDAVWVWGESGAMKIDPARGRVVSVVGVPGKRIMGFAAAGAQVSLATDLDELISFDARSGARRASIPIDAPTVRGTLAAVGGSVVMSQPGGKLASVDPVTGRELWVAHLGSLPRDLVLTGGRLWALIADPATGRGVLLGLDPGDGRTLVRIPLPAADARTLAGGGQTPVVTTQGGELLVPRPTR